MHRKNNFALQELKLLDNAMGSGHVLVYAFDMFIQLYRAEGYRERDAAELILSHNLFGLEIDSRAYQLAYFAIMMKARQYNRQILNKTLKINLHKFIDFVDLSKEFIERLKELSKLSSQDFDIELSELVSVIRKFRHVTEIGSILDVEDMDIGKIEKLRTFINVFEEFNTMDILYEIPEIQNRLNQMLNLLEVLIQKYTSVVTNPPYLNKMSAVLDTYVKDKYPDVKTDMFSVFIKKNSNLLIKGGYAGFMTPFVWMFIKSYEELRTFIIEKMSISSLIQMEYSAFEEATVPVCCFTIKSAKTETVGNYFKLSEFRGGMKVQDEKVLAAIADPNVKYFYQTNQINFMKIPGNPISFWASENLIKDFDIGKRMDEIVAPKVGLQTGNNEKFLRLWWEVDINTIKFNADSIGDAKQSGGKWFPYNKGGAFRRWYGNYDYVVNWENDGQEIRNFVDEKGKPRSRPQNTSYYFQEAITWSDVTSSKFSLRFRDAGSIHDVKGMEAFGDSSSYIYYILGLLNTPVGNYIFKLLNPTISLQIGNFQSFPVLLTDKKIALKLAKQNISIAKKDWNISEISWNYSRNSCL